MAISYPTSSVFSSNIAFIIPCHNEGKSIRKVVMDCKDALPQADVYVCNNLSTDNTYIEASLAGAIVINEEQLGKGNAVKTLLKRVDADIYVMLDGDDTYDLSKIREMIDIVKIDSVDMVVGTRLSNYSEGAFRRFHKIGNRLITSLINFLFNVRLKDVMSGLRVMNRKIVKGIDITTDGFEIETELTLKALKYKYKIKEIDIAYRERIKGSFSKLSTFKDGWRIIKTILFILKNYKPFMFFGFISALLALTSLLSGSVVVTEYVSTGYIKRVPLTILASGAMILSFVVFLTGVVLQSIGARFDELHAYLQKIERNNIINEVRR